MVYYGHNWSQIRVFNVSKICSSSSRNLKMLTFKLDQDLEADQKKSEGINKATTAPFFSKIVIIKTFPYIKDFPMGFFVFFNAKYSLFFDRIDVHFPLFFYIFN